MHGIDQIINYFKKKKSGNKIKSKGEEYHKEKD